MSIVGIDEIIYRSDDLPACRRFFDDFGLRRVSETADELCFQTLNADTVRVQRSGLPGQPAGLEEGPTVVAITWGVATEAALRELAQRMRGRPGFFDEGGRVGCLDPNGLAVRLQVTARRPMPAPEGVPANTWNQRARVDRPGPLYERATPIEIGHIVFYVGKLQEAVDFYCDTLGFAVSDRYPGRGTFLRCAPRGGHHDLFLLQLPSGKRGLNHVAFAVRDLYEVFGGGMHMDRLGWSTELGPGRHPISSATFWYFDNPAGALAEYYSDDDELTEAWQARDFEPGPAVFAEWALSEGLDGTTRREKRAAPPPGRFITDKTGT